MAERNAAIHGTSVLKIKYIFGLNCDCPQDTELLDTKTMYYSAGNYLTKFNLEDRTQDYAFTNKMYTNITAICLSPQKNFIAVARKGAKTQIQLLDPQYLRPKKSTMALSEEQNRLMPEFYYLSFSGKEDRIAALSNPKDPVLSYWEVDPAQTNLKLLGSYSLKGYICAEVSFHPLKNDTMTVVGPENFKILKYYDDSIKGIVNSLNTRKENPIDYVCHTWVTISGFTGIIVCTKSRHIYILRDNADILYFIENSEVNNMLIEPYCILATKEGFIIGGDGLRIQKFKKDESDYFKASPALRVNQGNVVLSNMVTDTRGTYIRNIKMDPDDDRLICVTDARTVYTALLKTDPTQISLDAVEPTVPNFSLALDPGHSEKINFLDCCVRKPLVATCSSDKTLKIWDYEKKELVHNMVFSEEVYAVSFHPTGLHIAVAFTDKVQLMNLYLKSKDHQRNFGEYAVKSCKYLKFNTGGDLLAVASGETPPEICVYKFYDYNSNPIHKFKGHTGVIRCFEWAPDGLSLYSCGLHGMVYKWGIRDGERKEINPKKVAVVNDMCITHDNNPTTNSYSYSVLLAVDDPESLREFNGMNNIIRTEPGPVFGCVVKSSEKKMIFAGVRDTNKDGSIYFYRHPLSPKETDTTYAHNSLGVSRMILTHKDRYLITGGMDGTIIIFEVEDKDARAGAGLGVEFKEFCPHILVTQNEIIDLNNEKAMLNGQLYNINSQGSTTIDMTGGSASEAIKSTNEFHKLKSTNDERLENLRRELRAKEEEKKKQLESEQAQHKNKVKELEVYSNGNLGDKQDMIKVLEKQIMANEKQFQERLQTKYRQHENEMQALERDFQERLMKEQDERRRIELDIEDIEAKNNREQEEIRKETENEYLGLERKYKEDENTLKNKQIKLKNEYQSNEKKLTKNRNKKNNLEEEKADAMKRMDAVQKNHTDLKKEIMGLENKLREKNVIITNSEKKIYDQKKRTGELEKFKYVLDFKIKELKKDMLPREREIQLLKLETTQEDSELKHLNSASNLLGETVKKLQEEQKLLLRKINTQKKNLIKQNAQIKKFKNDLYNAIQFIQNYSRLAEELKLMNTNPRQMNEIDEDIDQEYKSQIKFLAMSSRKLKGNLEKDAEMHKAENARFMRINVDLIRKIGKMKTEINKRKQSNRSDHPGKVGGLKALQEEHENKMHELMRQRESLWDQVDKLQKDLDQLKISKPEAQKQLEEEERTTKKDQNNFSYN